MRLHKDKILLLQNLLMNEMKCSTYRFRLLLKTLPTPRSRRDFGNLHFLLILRTVRFGRKKYQDNEYDTLFVGQYSSINGVKST
jgi:hypothetical protein